MPLADLYIGYARQDEPVTETRGDGKYFLSLRPGEIVTAVRARKAPGLRSAYDKIRIRRSIEYPVTGVAVALRREADKLTDLRVAFTGTNPRPVRLAGTAELCGGPLDARVFAGLDALVRDQIMAMKTTFTPGHYRRRVAGVWRAGWCSACLKTEFRHPEARAEQVSKDAVEALWPSSFEARRFATSTSR